jgi:hypothetical protein
MFIICYHLSAERFSITSERGNEMPEYSDAIRVSDQEALGMIRVLAEQDLRSIGNEVAWLIRQEYARRYSQPNSTITIEDAIQAHEAVKEG